MRTLLSARLVFFSRVFVSSEIAASYCWLTRAAVSAATRSAVSWATFWTNVVGCAVIGVFMVVITDVWAAHRLVRPFFGTGVLGGFTTYSAFAVQSVDIAAASPVIGLLLVAVSLFGGVLAAAVGLSLASRRVPAPEDAE